MCTADHAAYGAFRCLKCRSRTSSSALYAVACVVILAYIYLLWHLTVYDNRLETQEVYAADILKILTIYMQSMAILATLKLQWPRSLAVLATPFEWMFTAGSSIVPLGCVLPNAAAEHVDGSPAAVLIIMAQLLLPFAMLVAAAVVKLLVHACRLAYRKYHPSSTADRPGAEQGAEGAQKGAFPLQSYGSSLYVLALVVLFLFHPMMVRAVLALAACHTLDKAGQGSYWQYSQATADSGFWEHDMGQACWEGYHRRWALGLGIPAGLLVLVVVPVGVWVMLARNKGNLTEHSFKVHWGFLYRAYNPNCWWWSVVVFLQLIFLVAITTFVNILGSYYAMLLLCLVFVVVGSLSLWYKPYGFQSLYHLHLASTGCLWFTCFGALSFIEVDQTSPDAAKDAVAILLVVVNLVFIAAALYMLAGTSYNVCKEWLLRMRLWWQRHKQRQELACVSSMVSPQVAGTGSSFKDPAALFPAGLPSVGSAGLQSVRSAGLQSVQSTGLQSVGSAGFQPAGLQPVGSAGLADAGASSVPDQQGLVRRAARPPEKAVDPEAGL
jgi:hypothetical protein